MWQIQASLTCPPRNRAQAEMAEALGVSQPTISRVVAEWTTAVAGTLKAWAPTGDDLPEHTPLRVDGTLVPCWSWRDHTEDHFGKHRATGHTLIVAALDGCLVCVSDLHPGRTHDMQATA
jgi:hypothetical protein